MRASRSAAAAGLFAAALLAGCATAPPSLLPSGAGSAAPHPGRPSGAGPRREPGPRSPLAPAEPWNRRIVVSVRETAWLVQADGKIENLGLSVAADAAGETQPAPSPDGSRLAFIRAGSVWVANLGDRVCRQVTAKGPSVSIPGWTRDGRKLLVRLGRPQKSKPKAGERPLSWCQRIARRAPIVKAPAGPGPRLFLADLEEAAAQPLTERFHYVGARPLGYIELGAGPALPPDARQRHIGSSGQLVLAAVAPSKDKSQIVAFKNGRREDLTGEGAADDYQWPSLSPSETHSAYRWRSRKLVVDGKTVLSAGALDRYWWIDDFTLAAVTASKPDAKSVDLKIVRIDGTVLSSLTHSW